MIVFISIMQIRSDTYFSPTRIFRNHLGKNYFYDATHSISVKNAKYYFYYKRSTVETLFKYSERYDINYLSLKESFVSSICIK